MAVQRRTTARFSEIGRKAGHYESFYLKACHPSEPVGLWIRYTVHKRPEAEATGALWFTLFDGCPRAVKQTFAGPVAGAEEYIGVGGASFAPGVVRGQAEGEGRAATWDLTFDSDAEPLHHLPRPWMYRAPIPRTKVLSPHPDARFAGRAEIDGHAVQLDGWRGVVGHNWGAQHAERWIWTHASGMGEDGGAWLDAALGRIKVGSLTTPWIANGVLSLDGERHRLGGPGRARRTEVSETPDRCELVLPGSGLTVQATLSASRESFVGWVYADPDGSEHHAVNCSVAAMDLVVSRPGRPPLTLRSPGGAAYELGMREHDHGMAIQPFSDG